MHIISEAINYILSFKAYVMLPLIIFIFSLTFKIKLTQAIKSSLTIGIGFIGIFVIFGFFVKSIGPAVKSLISQTGLHLNVLDVGWPPLAAITWSYGLAPLLLVLLLAVNFAMLFFKWTKIVNIDIWNYWHFIIMGALVQEATGNIYLSIAAAVIASIVTLKLADWSAPFVNKFSGLPGIAISTLSAAVYYPVGVIGDKAIAKIPFINKLKANPDNIKKKIGILGEPMIIGFIIGTLLGIGARYRIREILELAFSMAAVVYILPLMSGVLSAGLMIFSEGMKNFLKKYFPDMAGYSIGLDVAVIVGNSSIVVTAFLLIPVALILAFILPGIKFIPLGDLPNIVGMMALVMVAVKGDVIRGFLIGIPIIIGKLYAASQLAGFFTSIAQKINFKFEGYDGVITSFIDGGNLFRYWLLQVFKLSWWALALIPVIALMLYFTRRNWKKYGGTA